MVRLYIEDDAGNVRIVPLQADEVSIGRAEDNEIVLPERNVSHHHARLRAVNGRFFVEDAGARYGVFLNGIRVDGRQEVRPGDLVGIGDFKVKVLPGEGEAEEAAAANRRGTVPEIPSMVVQPAEVGAEEPASDTSLISLRDMERVARQGWPSDFEHRDEVADKKSLARRLVVLVLLVAVAAFLVLAYIWATQPTEFESSVPAPARVVAETRPEPPVPSTTAEPVAAKVESPQGSPTAPAEKPVEEVQAPEVSPAPTTTVAPATRPLKETPRPTEPAKETPRTVAVVEPKPPRAEIPSPASPQKPAQAEGGDAIAAIEAAVQAGRLGEAERLLVQCRGSACANGWKKLGIAYHRKQQDQKAIFAFEKARTLTRDAGLKTWCDRQIESLRKGLGDQ